MNFKNDFERQCFEIARDALKTDVTIEHNKKLQIESAIFPEVASFKGPPTKEVDVLIAELLTEPRIQLLISCKQLSRRAEPAHVQEWCAVVQTMNKYSAGTIHLGLVLSSKGFSDGCESWASAHNIGILPPLKGRSLVFNEDTVLRMFKRVIVALNVRVKNRYDDLRTAPAFYDFVYRLVSDFEGHQEAATDGRYYLMPQQWESSFGEMYSIIAGKTVEDLCSFEEGLSLIRLSGNIGLWFNGVCVNFGQDSLIAQMTLAASSCSKNIEMESCSLDTIKGIVLGRHISSACDFGGYLEFGLDSCLNLGLSQYGFQVMSTENPIEEHRL